MQDDGRIHVTLSAQTVYNRANRLQELHDTVSQTA